MSVFGQLLAPGEFNTYLLVGLGSTNDSLVTSVTTRFDPPSPKELFSHLLTHEARLLQQASSASPTVSKITAISTTKQSSPRGRNGRAVFTVGTLVEDEVVVFHLSPHPSLKNNPYVGCVLNRVTQHSSATTNLINPSRLLHLHHLLLIIHLFLLILIPTGVQTLLPPFT